MTGGSPQREQQRQAGAESRPLPKVWIALVPVAALVAALYVAVIHFRELELTTHLALVVAAIVASLVAIRLGHKWQAIEDGMVTGIGLAIKACLILLVIGMLVGTWIQSGIVPTMIDYGLRLLSPSIFLVASCAICALVSLSTGSSWSTVATVGIALIGVGEGLGVPRHMAAGAIISGAYFGDKMSPLSDTTNLAPAVAGANLFDHIRHMVFTTGPSTVVALIGYWVLGRGATATASTSTVDGIRDALQRSYVIHPGLLLPPLLVIAMVVLRLPALPSVTGGWLLGALIAGAVQRQPLGEIIKVSYDGVKTDTGNKLVNDLLRRGGLSSMFGTVILVVCAMCFGGAMEVAGMLESLAGGILRISDGAGWLVAATLITCLGMNAIASDQYLSVVVPGRMYRGAFERAGLAPKNLSRALEDAGTLTSVLIPWNTCGAFMIATLGLEPWTYVPYCFLNLLNPLVSAFYGFTGITIARTDAPAPAAEPDGDRGAARGD